MRMRFFGFALCALSAIAACSGGHSQPPLAQDRAVYPEATATATATPTYNTLYTYVATNSNVIQQYASGLPGETVVAKKVAPDFALPAGCGPTWLRTSPTRTLMIATCFLSGELIPIAIGSTHRLRASTITPITGDAEPEYTLWPRSGVKNIFYVDDWGPNSASSGIVKAYAVTSTGLLLIGTSATGAYPQGMAFYTTSTASYLYVAAGDGIDVFTQNADGTLTRTATYTSAPYFFTLAASGGILVGASQSALVEFSIPSGKQISIPQPSWAASGWGPANADGVQILPTPVPTPTGVLSPDNLGPTMKYATRNADGTITVFDAGGNVIFTAPPPSNISTEQGISASATYVNFFKGMLIGGRIYYSADLVVDNLNSCVDISLWEGGFSPKFRNFRLTIQGPTGGVSVVAQ